MIAPMQPQARPLIYVGVPGQEGAASPRGEQLGAAEAQDADVAPSARFPSLDCRARHLGGILDYAQTVRAGNLHHFPHRHDPPVQVGDDYSTSVWTEGCFEPLRRQIPV